MEGTGVWSPINLAHAWSLTLEFLPFQKRIKFRAFQSLTKRCGEASASVPGAGAGAGAGAGMLEIKVPTYPVVYSS